MPRIRSYGCARVLGASISVIALSLFLFVPSWPHIVGLAGMSAASAASATSVHSVTVASESATPVRAQSGMGDMHMATMTAVDMQQMPIPAPRTPRQTDSSALPTLMTADMSGMMMDGTPTPDMRDMPGMVMHDTPMPDMDDMPGMVMDGTPMPDMSPTQQAAVTPAGTTKDSGMGDMPMPEIPAATGHQHGVPMAGMPDAVPATGPQPAVKATILGGFAAINLTVLVGAGILKRMSARVAAAERADREAVRHE